MSLLLPHLLSQSEGENKEEAAGATYELGNEGIDGLSIDD
jgi:hypothetical protein